MDRPFHRNRNRSVHVYNFDEDGKLDHQILSDQERARYVQQLRRQIKDGSYDAGSKLDAMLDSLFERIEWRRL